MRSKLLTTTVAALLLGGASLAHAQDTGFYAGAGAGQALVDERAYDDEDTAFSVFGGYQFHRNFALEAGYTDFGKLEPRGEGSNLELASASLTAVGILPFTEKFSGYAKAGFQRWDLDRAIPGLTGTAKDDGTDPVYGLGLQYRFNDLVALRGEYTRSEVEDLDVDAAQVQVRFDF
ncbi:outer membrane beta-barrel protein [Luteimonas composti]|uniref:Outer membrane beta-barrel protein n=1 Tax=Luteimonas composti TaxID=398257 RepID=A0ABT6MMY0_9GAMM|nr:outer membrane beta-barrel protein [Luteimonas composti]MDH7451946.1 outer membrane beta-barrel protein [Luteimonas composti]